MASRSLHYMLVAVVVIAATASSIHAQEESTWSTLKLIKPSEPDSQDSELRKLQKLRFNAALSEVKATTRIYEEGLGNGYQSLEAVCQASQRLTESAIDLHTDPKDQIKIYEGQLAMAKEVEGVVSQRTRKGGENSPLLHRAVGYRLNAEITLLKARSNLEKAAAVK
jgi:hypothetical protein